jgi:hypothetical protein
MGPDFSAISKYWKKWITDIECKHEEIEEKKNHSMALNMTHDCSYIVLIVALEISHIMSFIMTLF